MDPAGPQARGCPVLSYAPHERRPIEDRRAAPASW
jgi:hypothetical protein